MDSLIAVITVSFPSSRCALRGSCSTIPTTLQDYAANRWYVKIKEQEKKNYSWPYTGHSWGFQKQWSDLKRKMFKSTGRSTALKSWQGRDSGQKRNVALLCSFLFCSVSCWGIRPWLLYLLTLWKSLESGTLAIKYCELASIPSPLCFHFIIYSFRQQYFSSPAYDFLSIWHSLSSKA